MLKDILMILSGIIGGCLLLTIRKKIIELMKAKATNDNTTLEKFSITKFLNGIFNLGSAKEWAKDFVSIFNLRKLIIFGVILGVIFGYGYYKGRLNSPASFDFRGKEVHIRLNEHYLHIKKNGTADVVDKDGSILKEIKVKDIPELRKALRPYGFELKPFVTAGGSLGTSGMKTEGGVGVQWFKYFKWNLNSFLTNYGIYPLGVAYQVTDNFDIIGGAGKGYTEGDTRVYLGGKWRFW